MVILESSVFSVLNIEEIKMNLKHCSFSLVWIRREQKVLKKNNFKPNFTKQSEIFDVLKMRR